MFADAQIHRLDVVPKPLVIPAPDDTNAARSLWSGLLDFANLCRAAHDRDLTDSAREIVANAMRELRQARAGQLVRVAAELLHDRRHVPTALESPCSPAAVGG